MLSYMVVVLGELPLECTVMMVCHYWRAVKDYMSEKLGERRMGLIGRPSHTMPNGVIIGYCIKVRHLCSP